MSKPTQPVMACLTEEELQEVKSYANHLECLMNEVEDGEPHSPEADMWWRAECDRFKERIAILEHLIHRDRVAKEQARES